MNETESKDKVLEAFLQVAPTDLSVSEAAERARVSTNTASTYIKVLVAEGMLQESRRIGNAKLFRISKDRKRRDPTI